MCSFTANQLWLWFLIYNHPVWCLSDPRTCSVRYTDRKAVVEIWTFHDAMYTSYFPRPSSIFRFFSTQVCAIPLGICVLCQPTPNTVHFQAWVGLFYRHCAQLSVVGKKQSDTSSFRTHTFHDSHVDCKVSILIMQTDFSVSVFSNAHALCPHHEGKSGRDLRPVKSSHCVVWQSEVGANVHSTWLGILLTCPKAIDSDRGTGQKWWHRYNSLHPSHCHLGLLQYFSL